MGRSWKIFSWLGGRLDSRGRRKSKQVKPCGGGKTVGDGIIEAASSNEPEG